jgi:2-hydroxy-3-keto-5-methylthiopentenyl-1-phosphate phosphatase
MKKPVIALMYDFDKTLCTKDMQEYTFIPNVGMEPADFWEEVGKLVKRTRMDPILAYMYTMLDKARSVHQSIRREDFVDSGKALELYRGVATWFDRVNKIGEDAGARIEHYIISSGLREIIEGSEIQDKFNDIFACEFYYDENGVATWPKNVVNYTTKTQFLFRINKGILDLTDNKGLNEFTPEEERRIPFRNMIYLGDGMTDVPCMKLVKINGGYSIAVFKENKSIAEDLLKSGRVNFVARADYSRGGALEKTVRDIITKMVITDSLVRENKAQLAGTDSVR